MDADVGVRRAMPVRRLLVGALIGALALGLSACGGSGGGSNGGPSPQAIAAGDRAVRQATNQATQAGTAMSVAMANLSGLPTIRSVASAVDPYDQALLSYDSVLARATLGSNASSWRRSVRGDISDVLSAITSLHSMSSAQLGDWIQSFYLKTAELQSAVEELQAAVGDHSS